MDKIGSPPSWTRSYVKNSTPVKVTSGGSLPIRVIQNIDVENWHKNIPFRVEGGSFRPSKEGYVVLTIFWILLE